MRARAVWLPLALAALFATAAAPEPARPFPATLPGGTVVYTEAVQALLRDSALVLVDVSDRTHRPSGLAEGAFWMPPAHRDIPGSVWIPGAGRPDIPSALDAFFRTRLAQLTGGNRGRPILVYCHPHCWRSWNAARRVVGYGYRDVFWYPDGIEGWEDAREPTVPATPEGPGLAEAGTTRRD
jgi:PQQ-dependent catabolism-associated CXXCW motif protein